MKTSSAKAKGHRLEALIRDKLIEKFDLSSDDIRVTIGSENGADIKLSKRAQNIFPFKVEAKSRKSFVVYSYYDQAASHDGDLIPCVVVKANRRKPLVVLDFNDFLDLVGS